MSSPNSSLSLGSSGSLGESNAGVPLSSLLGDPRPSSPPPPPGPPASGTAASSSAADPSGASAPVVIHTCCCRDDLERRARHGSCGGCASGSGSGGSSEQEPGDRECEARGDAAMGEAPASSSRGGEISRGGVCHYDISPCVAQLTHGSVKTLPLPSGLSNSVMSTIHLNWLSSTRSAETTGMNIAGLVLSMLKYGFLEHPSLSCFYWTCPAINTEQMMCLIKSVKDILANESSLLILSAPVFVLGDLHGNYKDLVAFTKAFGFLDFYEIVASKLLLLGDYVDRGPHSIETLALLFSLKVLAPKKVFLLRGNHESPDINGDINGYGAGSLRCQCRDRFGEQGDEVWQALNECFCHLPLASVIDNTIFCVHGGIPRDLTLYDTNVLATIMQIRRPIDISHDVPYFIFDLLWSDPATLEQEQVIAYDRRFPKGFGYNDRGEGTCVFGREALRIFKEQSGCTHVIRAHQYPKLGIELSNRASTITVFSSSFYCGFTNMAAAVLVSDSKLELVIRTDEDLCSISALPSSTQNQPITPFQPSTPPHTDHT
ncbi:serine/threonine-protein phosphatase [Pelomyxa schiedti]|nr:serine/threonine-protein phosphatase [Pelomyxa schiedti]